MTTATKGKHLLSIADLSVEEVEALIRRAVDLKGGPSPQVMAGKSAALLFEKPSLRTKVSFDIAVHQLGGHPLYLGKDEVGMGVREPVSDTARILSRYVDVIIVRTFAQSTLEDAGPILLRAGDQRSLGRRAPLPSAGRSPYRLREEGRTEGDNHRLHWRWQQRGRQPCPSCCVGGGPTSP